jgi:hypothetical protein
MMHGRSSSYLVLAFVLAACNPSSRPSAGDDDGDGGMSTPDADVPGFCGDGVVQYPETCDPPSSCPTSCPAMECRTTTATGLASMCNVQCGSTEIDQCISADGCCPTGCQFPGDSDCAGVRIDRFYHEQYELQDLGTVPGLPTRLGGVTIKKGDPSKLLAGGLANTSTGSFYEIGLRRDERNHIIGFEGAATRYSEGGYNDGGVVYGPDDILFFARWPANELGQMKPGSLVTDKVIDLTPLGVGQSVAGIAFAPASTTMPGALKLMSWSGGQWHTAKLIPDGTGTYDLGPATQITGLTGGPEGMVYVPEGSPLFPNPAVLVSEFNSGVVSTYEVDEAGDPKVQTRRLFVIGLQGAEGATIDPLSGDFLFSTFGNNDHIIVVHGFAPIQ